MPKPDQLTDDLQVYSDHLADCIGSLNLILAAVNDHPLLPSLALDCVDLVNLHIDIIKTTLVKALNAIRDDMIPF